MENDTKKQKPDAPFNPADHIKTAGFYTEEVIALFEARGYFKKDGRVIPRRGRRR